MIEILACGQTSFDRTLFLRRYLAHEAEVRHSFAGRDEIFLLMHLESDFGWDPICPFRARPKSRRSSIWSA